ncbi:ectoderm-neural cortex protein 1-like [Lethenteron reissneri]|uniref:ectoderm-neural cortex protein 1-like n=1 Tax=Lethenteron reissneri TaxID=7753 RepID=UPI002AB738C2|nr:ectoderm-neural cortex protein 1-like [Lethenteron reissneri]
MGGGRAAINAASMRGRLPSTSSALAKSISTNQLHGAPASTDRNGFHRGRWQSTESLSLFSRLMGNSMESLPDDGDVIECSLMGSLEEDARYFEADSWSVAVDAKFIKRQNKDEIKRQDVIYELMQTEMHHIRTLRIMAEVFGRGLRQELGWTAEMVERLFPRLDDLLELHTHFIARLLERRRDSLDPGSDHNFTVTRVGDVLMGQFSDDNGDAMKDTYGDFCSQHCEAVRFYKENFARERKFQSFIRRQGSNALVRRLGVQECILLVTQRITKYPVLIDRILRSTKAPRGRRGESLSSGQTPARTDPGSPWAPAVAAAASPASANKDGRADGAAGGGGGGGGGGHEKRQTFGAQKTPGVGGGPGDELRGCCGSPWRGDAAEGFARERSWGREGRGDPSRPICLRRDQPPEHRNQLEAVVHVDAHSVRKPPGARLLCRAREGRVVGAEGKASSLDFNTGKELTSQMAFHDVRDACAEFLEKNLHPSNCLGMMLLSEAHQCRRLHDLAWRMCLANFGALALADDFLSLPCDKLAELVSSEELDVEDERVAYEAARRWVGHDPAVRAAHLPRLLAGLRLAMLPLVYLAEVAGDELIRGQARSREMVEEAMGCKLKILRNDGVVTSPCARPRKSGHALLLLAGQTFMCDKIYLVDLKAQQILPKADLPSPRKEFSACAVGCKVYVMGGRGSENGVSKDVWVYDTVHDEWSKAAPMLIARFGHGSAELEHCLYAVGGHTSTAGVYPASPSVSLKQVERYDPVVNKWTMVAPLRDGVSNAAVVSAKLRLYVFGTGGSSSAAKERAPKVQRYDPGENRWSVVASCPQPWRHAAAAVFGGQIFVMGGETELSAVAAYRFDCDAAAWTRVGGDVTAKRMSCLAAASGDKLYAVGGYFGTQRGKTLDCYDPALDTWASVTSVPYSLIPTAFVSTWKHLPA